MSNEEALAQAKNDFAILNKRVGLSQRSLKNYSVHRDEAVARIHVLLGGSYQDTGDFLGMSAARVYQILKRWKANNQ